MNNISEFCGSTFWDLNVTWYTEDPDFTKCFEQTVLVWIPCGFLWLLSAFEVSYAMRNTNHCGISNTILNLTQRAVILALIILQILQLAFTYKPSLNPAFKISINDWIAPSIKAATFFLAFALHTFNLRKGIQTSGTLFFFWFFATCCGIFEFRTELRRLPLNQDNEHQKNSFIILMITYPLLILELLLHCVPHDASGVGAEKISIQHSDAVEKKKRASKNPSPELNASFPSILTYQWFWELAWKGYKKPLEYNDLWDLNPYDKSTPAVKNFYKYWKPSCAKTPKPNSTAKNVPTKQKQMYSNGNETQTKSSWEKKETIASSTKELKSILPPLFKANWDVLLFGAVLKLIQDLLNFVSPKILELLIQHVSSNEEKWKGYFYAVVLLLTSMIQSILISQYFQRMFIVGMRVRSSLVGAIYQKSLVISNKARREFTLGEIVNLMSVDGQRFVDLTTYVNMVWSAPLQIGLSIYFLWNLLGVAVIPGLLIIVLLIPLNLHLNKIVQKLQVEQMKSKDDRVKLMNEILSGIKVLKFYAWEPSFQDQVSEIRQKELVILRKASINCVYTLLWYVAPFLVSLCSFATYVLMDSNNVLDAKKAFVALTLFNIMRLPMSMLPMIVVFALEAKVSLGRLNKFMNSEEMDTNSVSHIQQSDSSVSIDNGYFSWADEFPILKNIYVNIKRGSLVAIVGQVGSGKSSLLSAMLGEMDKQSGSVNTYGSIAYVAQQAWIQNATLRENILFGKEYDARLYKKVLDVCALRPDLQILPGGDLTEIGEKGINLSGGQKQRVSLARAAYCDSDVYLLDDPLSAVDSNVGKQLFENVIGPQGILASKTRVIVTHGITYLPHMDHIIVMNNGEISEAGSFSELLERKGAFSEFLLLHTTVEGHEIEDSSTIEELEAVTEDQSYFFTRKISRDDEQSTKDPREFYLIRRASQAKLLRSQSVYFKKDEGEREVLIEDEKIETGSVKRGVYLHYLKSAGRNRVIATIVLYVIFSGTFQFLCSLMRIGILYFPVILLSIASVLATGLSLYTNIWLSQWTSEPIVNGTLDTRRRDMYLGVYGALGVGKGLVIFMATVTMSLGSLRAAEYLHDKMLVRILRSPMSFFDTTPLGRIVNRFSKDVEVVDNTFPSNLRSWMECVFEVASTLVAVSYSTPWFLAVIVPVFIIYYLIQRFYVASSRQLKRLESVSRSPIYTHFSETLTGLVTIRAFGKQRQFINQSEDQVDHNHISYYPSIVANRWLAIRLETVGNLITFFAALFAVISEPGEGSVGLSVSYALTVTQILNWLVRMTSDVENNVVAIERMKEYGETPQEAAWEIPENKPPDTWPQRGNIKFKGFQLRYRSGLDLILKDVSFNIQPGEKIGIVGRTGAGKSSLTLGLFRLVEAAGGSIEIDDLDVSTMGLHDVRGKLTIIPQDPVLFAGTIRLNLDPFNKYSDSDIWHALEYAHLKQFVSTLPTGLEHAISEGGENLSMGQRQLMCLARALLRKTRILILDEATAAVDLETDDLIQQTIRSEFMDCTVLTIAHRLNTILDSDRIMVLNEGAIVEFASPQNLLEDGNSVFYSMAKDAGIA